VRGQCLALELFCCDVCTFALLKAFFEIRQHECNVTHCEHITAIRKLP
jgi:hypothetical protein